MEHYTVERLDSMIEKELDDILAMKLFDSSDLNAMMRQDWSMSYPRWGERGDTKSWSCLPPEPLLHPEFSGSYEGMARVIGKMQQKGFSLSITREFEVTFIDMDGKETSYAGDGEQGKSLPRFIAIAAILALESADIKSMAKWSLRRLLKW